MRTLTAVVTAAIALIAAGPASAAYPDKPIRMVVPFAAGGSATSSARVIATKLSEILGQQVVVENLGGANGGIGAAAVARSPADGYTVFYSSAGIMTVNPALYRKLPYATNQFDPVSLTATFASLLYVKDDFPAKDIPALVAYAKANPGKVTYGSAGPGSSGHLWGEVLRSRAGLDIRHIPYKGTSPALTDVMGGQITFLVDAAVTGMPQVKAGKLRALAATSTSRVAAAPEVPTFAEQGLAGFELLSWYGIFVPAGTPKPVVDTLQQAMSRAAASAEYQDLLKAQGMSAASTTPAGLAQQVQKESAYWAQVVRDAGVSLD